jgi:hypothetical protein
MVHVKPIDINKLYLELLDVYANKSNEDYLTADLLKKY